MYEPVLIDPVFDCLDDWLGMEGGDALERAHSLGPRGALDEVDRAGLRGRGGAGFPTGEKWRSVFDAPISAGERHVVVNAAEGEPGSFKDRTILRANPYLVLEGALIAAFVVGADTIHVGIRGRCRDEIERLGRAVTEAIAAGWFEPGQVRVITGPEHYLFGEEKGLLAAIEGDEPLPRWLPPYQHGLYATGPQQGWSAGPHTDDELVPHSHPTVVNNVETLALAARILGRGASWFRSIGSDESPGPVTCTVVGDTRRAGVGEFPMGTPLGEVIEVVGGGLPAGRSVKAVLSGAANPVLTARLEAPVSFEGLHEAGGGLGAAGFIVYDDSTDMVEVAQLFSRFLAVESCGQCNACKLGTLSVTGLLDDLIAGRGDDSTLQWLGRELGRVTDANRCYLPVQEQVLISSLMRRFPEDFALAIERPGVDTRNLPLPLIDDISNDRAVWDPHAATKQPDWTHHQQPG